MGCACWCGCTEKVPKGKGKKLCPACIRKHGALGPESAPMDFTVSPEGAFEPPRLWSPAGRDDDDDDTLPA